MWVPPEDKDPVLLHAPTRKSIALFGAVQIRSGKLVTMTASPFNAEAFAVFLRYLARHRRQGARTVLIVDNAGYHHPPNCPTSLRLDYLPPYSPDLNPIERVWKLLRRLRVHNEYFETLDRLLHEVSAQLALWSRPNDTLRRLCCIT
jgi:transposase